MSEPEEYYTDEYAEEAKREEELNEMYQSIEDLLNERDTEKKRVDRLERFNKRWLPIIGTIITIIALML